MAPHGTETVVLVEDEPLVRELATAILQQQGYRVVTASNGDEALRIIQASPQGPVDLLITDVVMPGMSGKALAEQIAQLYPAIKILFISGYATDAITQHGQLSPGTNFLSKPFTRAALAHKAREVLDS
jgi:CheY-like chemotaxis protein